MRTTTVVPKLEPLREAADEICREINALRKKDEPAIKAPSPQTLAAAQPAINLNGNFVD